MTSNLQGDKMTGRRIVNSLVVLCALLISGIAAQGATAAGQTAFTCAPAGSGAAGGDSGCEEETYEEVGFSGSTATTFENDGAMVLTVAKLHAVANVEVACTTLAGTGSMENAETAGVMGAKGSGKLKFAGCTTNQAGCTATIPEAEVEVEAVEGLVEEGMGLRFATKSGKANLSTITFSGSCGLAAFGAIPFKGTAIATAARGPRMNGAKAVFGGAGMSSLTVGGEAASLAGTETIDGEDGDPLLLGTT